MHAQAKRIRHAQIAIVIGRWLLVLLLVVVVLGVSGQTSGMDSAFVFLVIIFIAASSAALVLCIEVRCPSCNKRCLLTFDPRYVDPDVPNTLLGKIRYKFWPVLSNNAQGTCARCGHRYVF